MGQCCDAGPLAGSVAAGVFKIIGPARKGETSHNGRFHNRGLETIDLGIVQPRCPHFKGPVRSYVIDAVDLVEFRMRLVDSAEQVGKALCVLFVRQLVAVSGSYHFGCLRARCRCGQRLDDSVVGENFRGCAGVRDGQRAAFHPGAAANWGEAARALECGPVRRLSAMVSVRSLNMAAQTRCSRACELRLTSWSGACMITSGNGVLSERT